MITPPPFRSVSTEFRRLATLVPSDFQSRYLISGANGTVTGPASAEALNRFTALLDASSSLQPLGEAPNDRRRRFDPKARQHHQVKELERRLQELVAASGYVRDRFYMYLEKNLVWFWIFVLHAVAYFAVGLAIGWARGDVMAGLQFGLSLLVWGVLVRTVAVWHITWSVNSLTHMFGYSNYKIDDHSRNNWLVALLTVGEGWHNNHHYDQASASNQHRWWELDVTYYEIKLLQWLGLARNVTPPKHRRRAARAGTSTRQ